METKTQEQLDSFDRALGLLGCEVVRESSGDIRIRPTSTGIFKIQTKVGGSIRFVAKWEQCDLLEKIRRRMAKGKTAWIVILKARQIGFSTVIALLFLALALVRDTIDVLVASHEVKSQKRIWRIYKHAWRNLPDEYTKIKIDGKTQSRARYDSRQELEFKDNNTHMGVYVAGKGELGRSGATHCAHLSEFARWKDQEADLNAVEESVPDDDGPGAICIIETTANGWGDKFHDLWLAAEKAKDAGVEHPWQPHFAPWWHESAYQSKPDKNFKMDADEQRLYDAVESRYGHKLNKAQLQWRRNKIAKKGGNVRLFDQENPSTPEHAFLATGEHVFDARSLDYQITKYSDSPLGYFEMELSRHSTPFLRAERFVLDQKNVPVKGCLRIYRHPENRECIMMADPTHAVSDVSDPAAIHVFDVNTLEQLAVYEGRLDQHSFGDLCVALAKHYNFAYAVIESNGGMTTAKRVLELGYRNIHWHLPTGHYNADPTWQPGYITAQKSRDEAIRVLKRLLLEKMLVIYDARTLHEMQSFQEIRTGSKFKAQAPKDKHDNLVMAMAIGMHAGNAKWGWTQNGKLMRERKHHPVEHFVVNPRPLHETAEQAMARIKGKNKRQRLRAAFDCR